MQPNKKSIVTTFFIVLIECILCNSISFAQIAISPLTQHSEQWLEGKLQGILDLNDYLSSSDLDVLVRDGAITLRGTVAGKEEREFALKVAEKIGGTLKVIDNIRVNSKLTKRSRNDLEQYVADRSIEAKLRTLLTAFKQTHDEHFKTEVKNSVVYLKGSTLNNEARIKAGKIASTVYGTKDVKNFIQIREPQEEDETKSEAEPEDKEEFKVTDGWISDRIRSVLEYNSSFAGSEVLLAVRDGNVELKGRVKDTTQKTELINEVKDILGVTNITSSLDIRGSF